MVFNKLSQSGKRKILNSIIVFTIMLFIIGFYLGNTKNEKEIKNDAKQEEIENKEDGFSYFDLYQPEHETDLEIEDDEGQPLHNHDHDYPPINFEEKAEREVNILEDFFTQKEIEKAKTVSEDFVKIYYSFNGDNPTVNIEKALQYGTDNLKEKIQGQIVRPTLNFHSRKYTELYVYEPYNPSGEEMVINVRVTGEIFDSKGSKQSEEIVEYELKLVLHEDTYKVDDYSYKKVK